MCFQKLEDILRIPRYCLDRLQAQTLHLKNGKSSAMRDQPHDVLALFENVRFESHDCREIGLRSRISYSKV